MAEIRGSLKLGTANPSGAVSLAVVWYGNDALQGFTQGGVGTTTMLPFDAGFLPEVPLLPDGGLIFSPCDVAGKIPFELPSQRIKGPQFVAQSVTYEQNSLTRFTVPVQALPPEEALATVRTGSVDFNSHFALGALVAYEDLNENGTLDLGTPHAPGDAVFASSSVLDGGSYQFLVYSDADVAGTLDGLAVQLSKGFAWLQVRFPPTATAPASSESLSIPVELQGQAPDSNPAASIVGCSEWEARNAYVTSRTRLDALASVTCNSSRRYYSWSSQAFSACVQTRRFGDVCLANGTPTPEDWPCR